MAVESGIESRIESAAKSVSGNGPVLWLSMAHPGGRRAGSSTYSAGLLQATAAVGQPITLLTFGNGAALSGITIRELPASPRPRLLSLASPLPASVWALGTPAAQRELQQALPIRDWAAIVIDHAAMGWALPAVRAAGLPIAYISHNHEAVVRPAIAAASGTGIKGNLLRWDAQKFARLEHAIVEAASLITAITEEDAHAYRRETDAGQTVLTLTPGYAGSVETPRSISEATARRIILVGRYDWVAKQANLARWAAEGVPELARHGIETAVVGHVPLALQQRIQRPGLTFRGEVEDLAPELSDARFGLVAEELGGGFKMKTLDYIYHGLPIAALEGSLQGLPHAVADHAIVAPTPLALAKNIVAAIDDAPRLDRMQRQAHRAAERAFDWTCRGVRLAHALANCAPRRTANPR